jgi:hypothetical protein
MDEFKMSENTLDATLKRYKDAKCVEDCMDKSRAPKNRNVSKRRCYKKLHMEEKC